jgi:hypothetical protein
MAADIDKAVEEVVELVDELGTPERMTKEEYIEFLGAIISDLSIRKQATDDELEDEG